MADMYFECYEDCKIENPTEEDCENCDKNYHCSSCYWNKDCTWQQHCCGLSEDYCL